MGLKRGTQIISVPYHAEGDINHPDVEHGFVTSGPVNDNAYFCRYWFRGKPGDKLYNELRTKSCSELTPGDTIVVKDTRPQKLVDEALKKYCPEL